MRNQDQLLAMTAETNKLQEISIAGYSLEKLELYKIMATKVALTSK